ncbi:hypothetical protein BC936DRAFT_144428 [Jimgerdemannia flammicorona]|uniref:Uncharacterized protein n=1 Tax=Jimgerdemannia flammicorona TaxID=994334 RepID=A0A433DCG0_9FUNG|nr:hypothetical protein BC936DRAFT_144428 [Jimgerdemannia flammicorona]
MNRRETLLWPKSKMGRGVETSKPGRWNWRIWRVCGRSPRGLRNAERGGWICCSTMRVNFLSHFLLTNLLLDELKATPGARVVHTSSGMANSAGKIDLGNLNGEKGFSTARFYGNSKLLQIIYSNELNRRLETTGVISNAIHPGFIGSGIGSDVNPLLRPLRSFIMLFSSPPKDGALSVLYGAVANDVGSETMRGGRFFFNGNEKKMPPQAEDVVLAKKIWDLAEKLTSESKQDGNQ